MYNTKKFEIGGLELALRFNGDFFRKAEKRLGESVLGLFIDGGKVKIPPINKLLVILQEANQTSNVSSKVLVEAYDKFIEEGHSNMEIVTVIMELLNETGFSGKTEQTEDPLNLEEEEEDEIL